MNDCLKFFDWMSKTLTQLLSEAICVLHGLQENSSSKIVAFDAAAFSSKVLTTIGWCSKKYFSYLKRVTEVNASDYDKML